MAKVVLRKVDEPDATPPPGVAVDTLYCRLACGHCNALMTVDAHARGAPVRCPECGDYMIVPKDRFGAGVVIGDFVLQRELGQGALGSVYLAHQRSLDRPCAIKILHQRNTGNDEDSSLLLQQEARTAGRLSHANIVQCYMVGNEDGVAYFAMEYVEGMTVKALLAEKWRLPPAQAMDILRQVVTALDYAWKKQRLVHRDLKPENIMVTKDGTAKLADLGLAHRVDRQTAAGSVRAYGTPLYMSPEHMLGEPVDYRGDMFSLGVTLYECLTGGVPFPGDTIAAIKQKRLAGPPLLPSAVVAELPTALDLLVMRLLALQPNDRPGDYEALLREWDAARSFFPEPVTAGMSSTVIMTLPPPAGASSKIIGPVTAAPAAAANARRTWPWLVVGGCVLIIIGAVAASGIMTWARRSPAGVPPPAATTERGPAALPPIRIHSLLPDPAGYNPGHEGVILVNTSTDQTVKLNGWQLCASKGSHMDLQGTVAPGARLTLTPPAETLQLANSGDTITLTDAAGRIVHEATYSKTDVVTGKWLEVLK